MRYRCYACHSMTDDSPVPVLMMTITSLNDCRLWCTTSIVYIALWLLRVHRYIGSLHLHSQVNHAGSNSCSQCMFCTQVVSNYFVSGKQVPPCDEHPTQTRWGQKIPAQLHASKRYQRCPAAVLGYHAFSGGNGVRTRASVPPQKCCLQWTKSLQCSYQDVSPRSMHPCSTPQSFSRGRGTMVMGTGAIM